MERSLSTLPVLQYMDLRSGIDDAQLVECVRAYQYRNADCLGGVHELVTESPSFLDDFECGLNGESHEDRFVCLLPVAMYDGVSVDLLIVRHTIWLDAVVFRWVFCADIP